MPLSHAASISRLEPWGRDLHRPECVVGMAHGDVYVSDWRGGVGVIHADGSQEAWLSRAPAPSIQTNGFALVPDGSFLIANLGDAGGVWRLHRNGRLEPFLTEVDGVELPPANFVTTDRQGRAWISVSTRQRPRQLAWKPGFGDGFIALVEHGRARIVADGLLYTNEVRVSSKGDALFVVETFGRRLLRFPIDAGSRLGTPEVVVTIDRGFPDGFEFDVDGGLWITSVVANTLQRLHDGRLETMIADTNEEYLARIEAQFASGAMEPTGLGPIPGATLQHITSVTFTGADRRTVYLGALHGSCIHRCEWAPPKSTT